MNQDVRGIISRHGNLQRVSNALVEDVFYPNKTTGYLVVSHAVPGPRQTTSIQNLRLNVNRSTAILNTFGQRVCLCNIRAGMWIDAIFSSVMTRSIPPQTNAFLILIRQNISPATEITTDRIAFLDRRQRFLYTGNPNDINSQTRFVISDTTSITDRSGRPISFQSLRPGQLVTITHANFQTASIPPQTTAFHVQLV